MAYAYFRLTQHKKQTSLIGAMIFAWAQTETNRFGHRRRGTCGRAIDMDALGTQIVNAYGMRIQTTLEPFPPGIVTEMAQNNLKVMSQD
jgi:hypothetical protein